MSDLWLALTRLYLSHIRGYYRVQGILDRLRRQRIPEEVYASPRKLNLGSSHRMLPSYINVDVMKERHPDIVSDVSRLDFAGDNEYDLVRASHILEHFSFDRIPCVLAEWRRVLKPGGYLIVCVPNYRVVAWAAILRPSGYNLVDKHFGSPWIHGLFALDLPPEFRHQIVFTRKSLVKLLNESGFNVVGVLHYRKEHPYTIGITDDSCTPFSLNVAAIKR